MRRFWWWITGRLAVWELMWGSDEARIRVTYDRRDKFGMDKLSQIVMRWEREGWQLIKHPGRW